MISSTYVGRTLPFRTKEICREKMMSNKQKTADMETSGLQIVEDHSGENGRDRRLSMLTRRWKSNEEFRLVNVSILDDHDVRSKRHEGNKSCRNALDCRRNQKYEGMEGVFRRGSKPFIVLNGFHAGGYEENRLFLFQFN